MNRLLVVAAREFKHTVLTKAFFIGSVAIPIVIVIVSIAAEVFLKPDIPPMTGRLAVIGPSESIVTAVDEIIHPAPRQAPAIPSIAPGASASDVAQAVMETSEHNADRPDTTDLEVVAESRETLEDVKRGVLDGTWTAAIDVSNDALEPDAPGGGSAVIWIAPSTPASHIDLITSTTRSAVVDARLGSMGLEPAVIRAAMDRPSVKTMRIDAAGDAQAESDLTRFIIPVGFMGIIWIVTFTGGNYLLMSTIEEKGTRVMEVLLSATSPTGLLAGKIVGFAAVSAVMLAMYLAVIVVLVVLFAALDVISPGEAVLGVVFFLIAYLMIAAIMAGIGSAVSDITEAQSLMGPVMVVLMLPMLLIPIIIESPSSTVAIVFSCIPPLTPFVMVMRIAASPEGLPAWEIAASIGWSLICTAGMIWAAGRVFRVGVLMQGKPPTPMELLRWVRYR